MTQNAQMAHQVLDSIIEKRNPIITSIGMSYIRALVNTAMLEERFTHVLQNPPQPMYRGQPKKAEEAPPAARSW